MQMIFTEDNLDLKYFYMWVLLILYILLFKKHYIKNVYLFWHLAKSKLSLWFCLKKSQLGDLNQTKTETHELKQLSLHQLTVCVCVPFFLQTHWCPSPNSVSIFSTKHSLWPDICLQNKHIKSIFSFEP